MLSYTPPHQRGFGTQSRFMRAEVSRRATALPPSYAACSGAETRPNGVGVVADFAADFSEIASELRAVSASAFSLCDIIFARQALPR